MPKGAIVSPEKHQPDMFQPLSNIGPARAKTAFEKPRFFVGQPKEPQSYISQYGQASTLRRPIVGVPANQ